MAKPSRGAGHGELSRISVHALQRELVRRRSKVVQLARKAARLRAALRQVEVKIAALGGPLDRISASRNTGRRPRNEERLAEALQSLLKGKKMNVIGAAEAVQKAGYRTSSPNFRTIVNQTLLKRKLFRRVSRGVYTAR